MPISSFSSQGTIGATVLPKRYDIAIYEGDTFSVTLNFKDASNVAIDLTGFTGLCQFKNSANTATVATPTVTVNSGGVTGAVLIQLLDTTILTEGTYLYDVQLTDPSGKKRTYIGGQITVTGDISQ